MSRQMAGNGLNRALRKSVNRIRGVTLVEMLVIIVIIGVGMSIAVPSFQGMIVRNRIISQTNEMILAVNLARSEASRTTEQMSILPMAPTPDNEFGAGWCVVSGNNPPGNCPSADPDDVVRFWPALAGNTTMNSVENAIIQFNTLGGLLEGGPNEHNIDLCYPDFDGRRLKINLIGRVKSHMEEMDGSADPAPAPENQPCTCSPQSPHCP